MSKPSTIFKMGVLAVLLARCANASDHPTDSGRAARVVATVAVLMASDVIWLGDTATAVVEARDDANRLVAPRTVSWASSDPITATISPQGVVSALNRGETYVTATVGSVSGRARLTVLDSSTSELAAAIEPEMPRDSVSVVWPVMSGNQILVRQGDNLQRALHKARRGDEVVIDAGATFRGHFELPAKSGSAADGWIVVRTSAIDLLPGAGVRIDPLQHATVMPKLITPDHRPALVTQAGASGWRIVGLEVSVEPMYSGIQQGLVLLGDGSDDQRTFAVLPQDIILDRVYVHGQPAVQLKRCVALNSGRTAIIDSQMLECHGRGFDSQAIAGWNGAGPYLIENNRLEGAGEVIIFGGSTPAVDGLVPSDITIRRNHLYRPLNWRGTWTVKNLFELKNAQRVLVEANLMENNWVDGQIGHAVVLGSADTGYAWCVVQDVTFRFNHIHNSAGGFNLFDRYGGAIPMRRVAIKHNLLTAIGTPELGVNGRLFQLGGQVDDLAIENNTGFAPRIYLTFGDQVGPMRRFSFRNNLGGDADLPVHGGRANGASAVRLYATPDSRFDGNVIVTRMPAASLPPNNTYVGIRSAIGFDELSAGLGAWKLARGSPYRAAGVGSSTPGANIDELARRLSGVIDGAAAVRLR